MEKRPAKRKRSRLDLVLGLAFGFCTAAGLGRMIDSLLDWDLLVFARLRPGPLYLVLTGALWAVAGAVTLYGLLTRHSNARFIVLAAGLFIIISFWADRLFVSRIGLNVDNSIFALSMTLLFLVLLVGSFFDNKSLQP